MGQPIATAGAARRCVLCALCVTLGAAPLARPALAQQAPPSHDALRRNGYGDPFFPLSSAAGAACPTPLGPRTTREEARDDAHDRAGRGTRCRLAHRCSKPDAYRYDADIAKAVRQQLRDSPLLAGTSLWITVQRRFVYADGCASANFDRLALQRRLTAIDNVDRVFVRVTSDPRAMLPYPAAPR